jgi:hypothetical protein
MIFITKVEIRFFLTKRVQKVLERVDLNSNLPLPSNFVGKHKETR